MTDAIFVLNAGSSSLKFRIFGAEDSLPLLASGRIIGIGSRPEFSVDGKIYKQFPVDLSQLGALQEIIEWLKHAGKELNIIAMGHRIVHGGESFAAPVMLTGHVLEKLGELIPLAPLHQPHALSAVKILKALYPEPVQIGCFDTAFHAGHTPVFRHYALPKHLRDRGVRRYGFHGLSYEWTAHLLSGKHPELAQGRVVAAHLGNGASLCAMKAGKSIDTTMGMTALDGLPMGTRCGSIDPGVTLHMMRELGMSANEIDRTLSYESGLKGLSGISGDMRELVASAKPEARFAVDYFTMMTAQHVARMAVALGGLDALIFTGGIGEHQESVRQAIVQHLAFLPSFTTLVVEADEERMIARHCITLLKEGKQ